VRDHHLDRGLTLPRAHYPASLKTRASGLSDRLARALQSFYEPFDEAVRSRYMRRWVTRSLSGMNVASIRRGEATHGPRTECLERVGVRPRRLTRRSLPRALVAGAVGWLPSAPEILGTDVVYVAGRPDR
jgi:hypothetical protein